MSAYPVRRISADLPLFGSIAMSGLLFVALLGFTIDREHVCSQCLEGERSGRRSDGQIYYEAIEFERANVGKLS